MEKTELINQIKILKEEKQAVILAHYYTEAEVQAIADYVGDSYYLSKIAKEVECKMIVFAGVIFMGECAKILNPNKKVLLPDDKADCSMAHMVTKEKIEEVRAKYEDVAVVCYVNSTADIKAVSDVCVTSSNALGIVRALPQKHIFFIPDQHLAHWIAAQIPEKHFIYNNGYCHVHKDIFKEDVLAAKALHTDAEILVHPECTKEITELADYVGSTSGIIDYAASSSAKDFIICTESGILYGLQQAAPHKNFYFVGRKPVCGSMKRITLQKIYEVLDKENHEVFLDESVAEKAKHALLEMHRLGV